MKKLFTFVILGIVIGFFLVVTPGLAKKFYITPILEKVERTPAVEPNTGNSIENKVTFKDPLINITWTPDPKGFGFVVINVSASPLSVVWDECYINDSFSKYTIVHSGVKDTDVMPPTEISSQSDLKDFLYPSAFVRYVRGKVSNIRSKSIYKRKLKQKEVDDNAYTPQTFLITLALDSGGNRYTYTFHFKTELEEK